MIQFPLLSWYKVAHKAKWKNFNEIKQQPLKFYPESDQWV